MSRLSDIIRQVANTDAQLAKDLQRETDALADRRAFGLNFERHVPEAVELPGRPVRKNDKVRMLPDRGENPTKEHERLHRVTDLIKEKDKLWANLQALDDPAEECSYPVDDLVVVAEFRDPIYPGLVSTGTVERGGDKPFHSVINAENYHALQALLFTHRGQVDCIYIDPPYNTGAKDWKYNNDYVESDDHYRHSKWLAFMERRLLLAKELLNPDDSVLIVTIDEKEYLRLGLLLEQVFPEARMQMVSVTMNARVVARSGEFGRSNEFAFFLMFGAASPAPLSLGKEWLLSPDKKTVRGAIHWASLSRTAADGYRTKRPGCFYPIFVRQDGGGIQEIGDAIPLADAPANTANIPGTVAVWPIRSDGREGRWQLGPETAREVLSAGYMRAGPVKNGRAAIYYLKSGERAKVESGEYIVSGRAEDGSVLVEVGDGPLSFVPAATWNVPAHDAGVNGTQLLRTFVPGQSFPFPKSLFAVEDAIRFFVANKPDATVMDFFAGSGTTAHAVMRLNRQDGGRRRSTSVTNNEVSADEQKRLREQGLRPGDAEWEQWGICDHITKPRILAAVTGKSPKGDAIKGDYKFTDEFPMAEGFEENVEFLTLTYESAMRVASNREFTRIAPFLWLRAGSKGRRIEDTSDGWDVADAYGVIADLDLAEPFLKAVEAEEGLTHAFIVTDEDRLFEAMVRQLPEHVEPVRLYSTYLRNFEIEAGRAAR